jgi:hypothetical protein
VLTTTEADHPNTQIPHPTTQVQQQTHPHTSTQPHNVSINTGRPEGPMRHPSAQEETFTTNAEAQNQEPYQQIETLEDELACLCQENERLRLVQEQMIRQRVVMKRAQIMQ